MSDRWYIYKDGQALGPMTAAQIRDGLRDGSFDPFDLVSRDGSHVRLELVEVDEIFFNKEVVYGDAPASPTAMPAGPSAPPAIDLASGSGHGGVIRAEAASHARPAELLG